MTLQAIKNFHSHQHQFPLKLEKNITTSLLEVFSAELPQNLSTPFRSDIFLTEELQSASSTISDELFNTTPSEPNSIDVSSGLQTHQPELFKTTTPFSSKIRDKVATLHFATNFILTEPTFKIQEHQPRLNRSSLHRLSLAAHSSRWKYRDCLRVCG